MALTQTGPERGRYMVRAVGDAIPLKGFIDSMASHPAIAIVDRIGPDGQPHTVVLETSHDQARALEQQFQQAQQPLIIEPDSPLSLFGGGPQQKGI